MLRIAEGNAFQTKVQLTGMHDRQEYLDCFFDSN